MCGEICHADKQTLLSELSFALTSGCLAKGGKRLPFNTPEWWRERSMWDKAAHLSLPMPEQCGQNCESEDMGWTMHRQPVILPADMGGASIRRDVRDIFKVGDTLVGVCAHASKTLTVCLFPGEKEWRVTVSRESEA